MAETTKVHIGNFIFVKNQFLKIKMARKKGCQVQNNLGEVELGRKGKGRGNRVNIGDIDEMVSTELR